MSKTIIVDGNSLLFRAYYSTAYTGEIRRTKDGIPVNAIYAFHNRIKKIKSDAKDKDHVFVSFDTGEPTFRKQEFKDYKAQRSKAPDDLVAQMPLARERLTARNIFWDERVGLEGDDLAGSRARYAAFKGDEVVLYTSDKDFLQLLDFSEKISLVMLKRGLTETITYTKDNLKELRGLYPCQIPDFKGIAGDPSDNYKGIPGIGEKTTRKLLDEYHDLDGIRKYAKENPTSKQCQKLLAGEETARFCKELATIKTDVDRSEDYNKSQYAPYLKSKLSQFYTKYQFSKFISQRDKRPGLEDDLSSHQRTLFEAVEEEPLPSLKEIRIHSLSEIKEDILGITYDSSSENENTSVLYGFALAGKENSYLISNEDASKDTLFSAFLSDEKKQVSVYDQKGLLVLLSRYHYPAIKGVAFDLLLASYLLNPDAGQKRSTLFLSYDISLDINKNLAGQSIYHTIQLKDKVRKKLEENQETDLFSKVELPLSDILASREIEGFPRDKPTLQEIDEEYKKILSSLEQQIYSYAGKEFKISSPKQIEQLLFTDLGIQRSKGEKGTGIEVLLAHRDDHPIVPLIIQYRKYAKLVTGYTSSLPDHVQRDGKIHALYNQALTATGRLSRSEPNLQNISIRDEEGKSIRKAFFYPGDEYYRLSLDYSQIELRRLAHIGKIKTLVEIFKEGQDIHTATASRVFHVPFDEVTPERRRRAKAVNFGIVYGISAHGLSEQLSISNGEAKELISQFKETFEGLDEFEQGCIEGARKLGYVQTILNRRRYLKDINSTNRVRRMFSERASVNSVIQGSAADLRKISRIKVNELLKNYKTKIILQIHDELLFKVPKEELDIIQPKLVYTREHARDLSVPLKVDGESAHTWYEVH